jgi:LPS O-antigen subunit length determinant protein (WzzB/FepE family)
MLWDARRQIRNTALIGLVIGVLAAFLIPPRYTSVAKLMPPDSQSNSGISILAALSGKSNALAGMAGDLLGANSSGDLFMGILQSRTVKQRLVQRFDLKQVYWDRLDEDAQKDLAEHTEISEITPKENLTIKREKLLTLGLHGFIELYSKHQDDGVANDGQ